MIRHYLKRMETSGSCDQFPEVKYPRSLCDNQYIRCNRMFPPCAVYILESTQVTCQRNDDTFQRDAEGVFKSHAIQIVF